MIDKYRALFINPLGLEVLADIFTELRFGGAIDPCNHLQIAQHNLAVVLLGKLGIFAPDTAVDVIKALASIAPSYTKTEEEPPLY